MATYNLNLAFVKYYVESVPDYNQKLPITINNPKDTPTYVKATILNQGALGFTFDDGTTEKTYTVNANSSLSVTELLVPATNPAETMKDSIQIKLEYYKDDAYTKLFGEDVLNVQLNYYIENADGTWTSSTYTDENAFIWDKWPASTIATVTLQDKATVPGVNGKPLMVRYTGGAYSSSATVTSGVISSESALFYIDPTYHTTVALGFMAVQDANTPAPAGFLATVLRYASGTNAMIYGGYNLITGAFNGVTWDWKTFASVSTVGGLLKIVGINWGTGDVPFAGLKWYDTPAELTIDDVIYFLPLP
ncbi:hypothetical protein CL1_0513 [Thermococcus cleftensis]|uniref:Uncharacterized protein n=1 Tax=Thermococcus cleftensis (strain DSM 27260 / KACC 17922 / CL1) TaxID=163003 RepID=I3ZSN7_THECF|nr:hypothetical protein [Thermococcus cleftensis]AFL94721.1 hypothetical protein CL1_0513 [Thermococcus cleftensis]